MVVVPQRPEERKLVQDCQFARVCLSQCLRDSKQSRTARVIKCAASQYTEAMRGPLTHGVVTLCEAHLDLSNVLYVSIQRATGEAQQFDQQRRLLLAPHTPTLLTD